MSSYRQNFAMETAKKAFDICNNMKDRVKYIKEQLDKRFGNCWHYFILFLFI